MPQAAPNTDYLCESWWRLTAWTAHRLSFSARPADLRRGIHAAALFRTRQWQGSLRAGQRRPGRAWRGAADPLAAPQRVHFCHHAEIVRCWPAVPQALLVPSRAGRDNRVMHLIGRAGMYTPPEGAKPTTGSCTWTAMPWAWARGPRHRVGVRVSFPLVAVDGPCGGGDRDDPAAQGCRVEALARPPGSCPFRPRSARLTRGSFARWALRSSRA